MFIPLVLSEKDLRCSVCLTFEEHGVLDKPESAELQCVTCGLWMCGKHAEVHKSCAERTLVRLSRVMKCVMEQQRKHLATVVEREKAAEKVVEESLKIKERLLDCVEKSEKAIGSLQESTLKTQAEIQKFFSGVVEQLEKNRDTMMEHLMHQSKDAVEAISQQTAPVNAQLASVDRQITELRQSLAEGKCKKAAKKKLNLEKWNWSMQEFVWDEEFRTELVFIPPVFNLKVNSNSVRLGKEEKLKNDNSQRYDWRIHLKSGDLVDAKDKLKGWYESTVMDRKDDQVLIVSVSLPRSLYLCSSV